MSTTTSKSENIIDGKAIANSIHEEIKEEVTNLVSQTQVRPGLAVVLVGARKDSATYVRMKQKACDAVGVHSVLITFPEDVTQDELMAKVSELNNDDTIHGILVQLPIPKHIHEQTVLDSIAVEKDVDGLHPINMAQLAQTNTHGKKNGYDLTKLPFSVACTPQGCIELIERSGISIEGKNAVVIGRSNIVGIPMSLLLMQKKCNRHNCSFKNPKYC
jgi:5,10-methylene-tetrahydrofolate dehydrogenase/methenyl tetrahydrofolate cyclohydrolase